MKRREFIKKTFVAFLGVETLFNLLRKGFVIATSLPPLPPGQKAATENDPIVSALGYKTDVSKINFKQFPQRNKPEAKSQNCGNCKLYTKMDDNWGKCQVIANGLVYSKGWCGSWIAS